MHGMIWRSAKIKLLSVFVLTFICLNAGGAVCVAYCRGFTRPEGTADHCPLAKFGAHCPNSKDSKHTGPAYIEFNSMDCCVLSVSLITAPVEKRQSIVSAASALVVHLIRFYAPIRVPASERVYITGYSPPLADRQFTHIKNRVLRI